MSMITQLVQGELLSEMLAALRRPYYQTSSRSILRRLRNVFRLSHVLMAKVVVSVWRRMFLTFAKIWNVLTTIVTLVGSSDINLPRECYWITVPSEESPKTHQETVLINTIPLYHSIPCHLNREMIDHIINNHINC